MAEYIKKDPDAEGLKPTTSGQNRPFWNDRFVEPKQQHRFTVKIPIYTPMGVDKDTLSTANHVLGALKSSDVSDKIKQAISRLPSAPAAGLPNMEGLNEFKLFKKPGGIKDDVVINKQDVKTYVEIATHKNKVVGPDANKVLSALRIEPGPANSIFGGKGDKKYTYESSDGKFGLYMRIPEYIGYSFKPPGFTYAPGDIGGDGAGNTLRVEGMGTYGLTSATLTFVTTLRDDLHFSLGLLWALSTSAKDSRVKKSSVRLFDSRLTGKLPESEKVITIYEHYARPVSGPDGKAITPSLKTNENAVSGIHKLYDPVIESVDFGEFSYGGADLVKVTMTLSYGANHDQSNFYSYQNTESRYGNGEVYAMDEGDYKPVNDYFMKINPPHPIFGSLKDHLTKQRPNKYSPNSDLRDLTLQELKERRRNEQIGLAKERLIMKQIFEGDNIQRKNELFSRAISDIIADREDAEDRARQADADIRRELVAASNELSNEMEQRRRETDAENQTRTDHISQRRAERYVEGIERRAHIVAESRAAREAYEARRAMGADDRSLRDTLERRISRLSDNQSSSGDNVSEFGRKQ